MSSQIDLDKLLEIARLRRENREEYDALMKEVKEIMVDLNEMVQDIIG